ncbi:MAG TPA: DUF4136 domain-containing protein [Steroidobacteraceae bacterium]|jgi:hypothetical protein|nr:DUF4136 domain-containing protein [Steroidobacteraceae bacterium]
MKRRLYPFALTVFAALLLGACATQRPHIRTLAAPDANFTAYNTFGFPEQTGTDRGGYSTLITSYFKKAVREQMEARGYQYVDANPDLLVNFYANAHERTEVRSSPRVPAYGYYGYRYGLYDAWPLYQSEVHTVTYPVGTANVDVVDAKKRQLIWEGLAQGRIHDKDMEHPDEAIRSVVTQLFSRFPGRAGFDNANATTPSS